MNDAVFLFVVVPLTISFVGFVFTLVYAKDILGWYFGQLAAQRQAKSRALSDRPNETFAKPIYHDEPASGKSEKQLAAC